MALQMALQARLEMTLMFADPALELATPALELRTVTWPCAAQERASSRRYMPA